MAEIERCLKCRRRAHCENQYSLSAQCAFEHETREFSEIDQRHAKYIALARVNEKLVLPKR
jgi:hypothetical protein